MFYHIKYTCYKQIIIFNFIIQILKYHENLYKIYDRI